jgi:Tol biopolymer transport system component
MLVGRVPFRGTTPHATLHAVIYEPPPPPRQINPNITPALESVILKAVAKRPEQRFQSGAGLLAALRAALEPQPQKLAVTPAPRMAPPPARRSPQVWLVAAIVAILLLVAVGLYLLLNGAGSEGTPVGVITHVITSEATAPRATETAIQPPPTNAPATSTPDLPTEMPAAESPSPPTDSPPPPTNTSIPPTDTPLAPADTPLPPTNSPPPPTPVPAPRFGRLAFSSNRDGNPEIYAVNLAGGDPVRLTNTNTNDWLPDWSPDGRRIAFTSNRTGSYDLWVTNDDGSGQALWVATGAWDEYARWAPDGQRLSLSTTATTQGVPNSEIFVRQPNGSLQQITFSPAEDQWADWSPDGRIVFTEGYKDESDWDIHIVNANGSNRTVWLGEGSFDVQPAWSPDGEWIAFLRISRDINGNGRIDYEDPGDIWVGRASGGGLRQLTSGLWAVTPTWSPDSQWIAFAQLRDTNGNGGSDGQDAADILAVPLGGGNPVPLLQSPHRDGDPAWTW